MSIPTVSLNETTPAGGDKIREGDDRIREFKKQVREILNVDHKYESSGQDDDMGKHDKVAFLESADLPVGAEGKPILGAQTQDGKAELVFVSEDNVDVQITSKDALLAGRLLNNTTFKSRNNAGSGDVDILKVGTDNIPIFSEFIKTPSSAPDADYEVANKKYVDDSKPTFGSWASRNIGTVYQAATDGFVTVYTTVAQNTRIVIYTDGSTPPTIARVEGRNDDQLASQGFSCPVKKDDYYKVASTGGTTGHETMYWLPQS